MHTVSKRNKQSTVENGEHNKEYTTDQVWGWDVNTRNEVNLSTHVADGGVGLDDEWNVASEYTVDALVQRKQGGKKGNGWNGKGEIVYFACGRKGHMKKDCRSTTLICKGKSKGKGESKGQGKDNSKGKGKNKGN